MAQQPTSRPDALKFAQWTGMVAEPQEQVSRASLPALAEIYKSPAAAQARVAELQTQTGDSQEGVLRALVPVLNKEGVVVAAVPIAEVYNKDLLHPEIAIFIKNAAGEVLVTLNPDQKIFEPGRWAPSIEGPSGIGESPDQQLARTAGKIGLAEVDKNRLISLGEISVEPVEGVIANQKVTNNARVEAFAYVVNPKEEVNLRGQGMKWERVETLKAAVVERPEQYTRALVAVLSKPNLPENLRSFRRVDAAMRMAPPEVAGGIDFDPRLLNLKVERTGDKIQVTVDPAELQRIQAEGVDGFMPVIIDIVPVKAMLPALGLSEAPAEAELAGV
jgi:isopentenyldiphosphate isomerase